MSLTFVWVLCPSAEQEPQKPMTSKWNSFLYLFLKIHGLSPKLGTSAFVLNWNALKGLGVVTTHPPMCVEIHNLMRLLFNLVKEKEWLELKTFGLESWGISVLGTKSSPGSVRGYTVWEKTDKDVHHGLCVLLIDINKEPFQRQDTKESILPWVQITGAAGMLNMGRFLLPPGLKFHFLDFFAYSFLHPCYCSMCHKHLHLPVPFWWL